MVKDGIVLGERYEIISKLGAGGMADVYKSRDKVLNRYVAVKVLKKEYREDENFVKKFRSEAQAAAGLMHQNVVNVYDVGVDRGLYYMVMELVEGITLKDYIEKKGVLSSKEVISITIQICAGIGAVHRHHMVHRDIKPQNIIISKEGKVKVTDFGIAKSVSSNTISSNAMGSVHYTSPEQARGGFSDEKSDIYSIGITMYEMVTGRVPFDGESTVAIAVKHLQEAIVPPSEYVDLPYSLEQIILKCTQKSPDRRYPNVDLLVKDLKRSLIDPEGDFVYIASYRGANDTIALSDEDMRHIQDEYDHRYEEEYDDDGYDDHYDDDDYDDEYDYDDHYDDYDEYDDDRYEDGKPSDVNANMKKPIKILMIVAGVIIAVALVMGIGNAAGVFKFGPGTKQEETEDEKKKAVPQLVGEEVAVAKKMAEDKGFAMKIVEERESSKYEEGIIISQTPDSGKKLEEGGTIEVVVSSGPATKEIQIPTVEGQDEDTAMELLREAGVADSDITQTSEYSSDYRAGLAIRTEPKAGSVIEPGQSVKLVISKGAEPEKEIKVPSVKGQSEETAKQKLTALGLNVKVDYIYDTEATKGLVISQTPGYSETVGEGATVVITVSKGEDPEKANEDEKEEETSEVQSGVVPNVVGKWQSNLDAIFKEAGVKYQVTYAAGEQGKVLSTDPAAGTKVDADTVVTVVVGKG